MRILAIETSCDETALAIADCTGGLQAPTIKILKNEVASQVALHAPFGGVVPNIAKREHLNNLPVLYRRVFRTGLTEQKLWRSIDLVTVTVGPGLEPALWAGINFAEQLAKKHGKPLLGANHLEGHLYSFLLAQKTASTKKQVPNSKPKPEQKNKKETEKRELFPAVALIASGGHTILLQMNSLTDKKILGETRDDAAGEAFDKVARMLDLPYPGGPALEKLAAKGNPAAIDFPRPMLHDKNYDFSFSGLKTAVLYYLRDAEKHGNSPATVHTPAFRADVAASFQKAAIDVLVGKTIRAAKEFRANSVFLSGGVAANRALRMTLQREAKKIGAEFFVSAFKYNTDNAVMVSASAYIERLSEKNYPLQANGNLTI